MLDHAADEKKPIIFITDDRKFDWWLEHSGRTIGPRPELVHEMKARAGVPFHMYSSNRFIEYAQELLELTGREAAEAVEEIAKVSVTAAPTTLGSVLNTIFSYILSAADYQKALELYAGPHRTLSAFITIAERPQTLAEISHAIVADEKWTDSILTGLSENGLVYRQEGWPNTYHLTDYGRSIKIALDQLPPEVKEEAFREKWLQREELLSDERASGGGSGGGSGDQGTS
jgi:predicted transcriptional regulator